MLIMQFSIKGIQMNDITCNTAETNLKELFDEFKNKQTKTTKAPCQQLKAILGQLQQSTLSKRNKKKILQEMESRKLKTETSRPNTTLMSRIWKPATVEGESLQDINKNLLVIQNQGQFLKDEINNLQNSLSQMKKNLTNLRKLMEKQNIRSEKYKHISYLSNSIQRNTDSTKILNIRSYRKMVEQQEETLNNLKKFKTALRKQNQEIQNKFSKLQLPVNPSKKKLDEGTQKLKIMDVSTLKLDRSFMARLEELLELFIHKESSFEQIKAQQTTKVRLKKIKKQFLPADRVRLHDMIDKFQDNYDVKIQSLGNLIIFIFRRLNEDNDEMQNKCIKLNEIKQALIEQYDNIIRNQNCLQMDKSAAIRIARLEEQQHKNLKISLNSQVLVKVIYLFHNLIGKFKYLFTMALTLSKQKKNFRDLLIQIQNLYNQNQIFNFEQNQDEAYNYKDMTNLKEIQQIFRQRNKGAELSQNEWLFSLVFCDLRNGLIFRKKWLQQQLMGGMQDQLIIQKVKSLQTKCDEMYDSKFKVYSLLLINCLKAVTMNKYEKKMACSSNAKDSLFMSAPKKIKIYNLDENEHGGESIAEGALPKTEDKFNSEYTEEDDSEVKFSSDPRKIVQLLEKARNEEKTTFRPLHLEEAQVYMYGRKVVMPKYIL